jgi:hypothetical protein
MDSPSMHGEAAGAAPVEQPKVDGQIPCGACPALFKPKKKWQRFCSPKCRNDWHQWTKSVREARELVRAALTGGGTSEEWNVRARKLLGIK